MVVCRRVVCGHWVVCVEVVNRRPAVSTTLSGIYVGGCRYIGGVEGV